MSTHPEAVGVNREVGTNPETGTDPKMALIRVDARILRRWRAVRGAEGAEWRATRSAGGTWGAPHGGALLVAATEGNKPTRGSARALAQVSGGATWRAPVGWATRR